MTRPKRTLQEWLDFSLGPVGKPPAAKALELNLVTSTELLRLKALARWHARGLPAELDWSDLLQEAFARILDGSRKRPEELPMVVFVTGVMRSIKAQYWRRARAEGTQSLKLLADLEGYDGAEGELPDPTPDVERGLIAAQQLLAIERLFSADPQACKVLAGLGAGMTAEEIRARFDISRTDYESTRRRMRRVLLREGLRMQQP
jgi:RNA polymerase sigma-70 factor (ECF subfamily)